MQRRGARRGVPRAVGRSPGIRRRSGHQRHGAGRHRRGAAARRVLLPARDASCRRSSCCARHGVPMAMATDCNPGNLAADSPLLMAMNLAATLFRMTVEECLIGVTRAAAQALGHVGPPARSKPASTATSPSGISSGPAELVYRMGFNPLHARVWRGHERAGPSRMAVGASRRCAAGGELSAYRHRDSRRRSNRSWCRRGWRARTRTSGWMCCTTSRTSSAPPPSAPRCRAPSSTSIAIRPALRCIRARPPPACARSKPSTASRCTSPGSEPDAAEILRRRAEYFDPYHAALAAELERKRARASAAWCSTTRIRSARACRGCSTASCRSSTSAPTMARPATPALTAAVEKICDASGFTRVTNGRFRGGWITRHYGNPRRGIHAMQMELAMRGYLHEPEGALDRRQLARAARRHARRARCASRCATCSTPASTFAHADGPHEPHRHARASSARPRARRCPPKLAHRSAAAHAHEQSRSGRRRAARGTGGLRRHRPRRARLGELRRHRRDTQAPRGRSDAC